MIDILFMQEVDLDSNLNYRVPDRFPTKIFSGVDVDDPNAPTPVGVATTFIVVLPRTDGFQVQVAEKLEPEPLAVLFLHPLNTVLPALKVTFDSTFKFTVTTTGVLKLAVVAFPASVSELNDAINEPGPAGGKPAGDL